MKILSLQAENVKRLSAVYIEPKGSVVELTGRNRQGKTSVLDAIWMAFKGAMKDEPKPIRTGAERAVIRIDLGEYVVTRTFKSAPDKSPPFTQTLTVENTEGFKTTSPQTMLNNLIGELSFDPLSFTRMKPTEQFEALKAFVTGFDFEENAKQRKALFDDRTDANRTAKSERTLADSIVIPEETEEVIDEAALVSELEMASQHNNNIDQRKNRREALAQEIAVNRQRAAGFIADVAVNDAEIEALEKKIADLRQRNTELQAQASEMTAKADADQKRLDEAPALPEPKDISKIAAQLNAAREKNAVLGRAKMLKEQKDRHSAAADAAEKLSRDFTKKIEDLDAARINAVANAKMPIDGIGFGDDLVLFNSEPFSQASDAEQLRVSVAIAAAMNPKLRVIRIRDGSLLDDEAWAILTEFADTNDLQIWAETVQSDRPAAIVIEDGTVKAAAAAE